MSETEKTQYDFYEYIDDRSDDIYFVSFPNREFQEYLKIPDKGKLSDLVKLFESMKSIIQKMGFRWNVDIDEEKRLFSVTNIVS